MKQACRIMYNALIGLLSIEHIGQCLPSYSTSELPRTVLLHIYRNELRILNYFENTGHDSFKRRVYPCRKRCMRCCEMALMNIIKQKHVLRNPCGIWTDGKNERLSINWATYKIRLRQKHPGSIFILFT